MFKPSITFIILIIIAVIGTIIIAIFRKKMNISCFYIVGISVFSLYALSALELGLSAIKSQPNGGENYDIGMILIDNFVGSILFGLIVLGFSIGYKKILESSESIDVTAKDNKKPVENKTDIKSSDDN